MQAGTQRARGGLNGSMRGQICTLTRLMLYQVDWKGMSVDGGHLLQSSFISQVNQYSKIHWVYPRASCGPATLSHMGGGGVGVRCGTLTPIEKHRCLDQVPHLTGTRLLGDSLNFRGGISFLNAQSVIVLSLALHSQSDPLIHLVGGTYRH